MASFNLMFHVASGLVFVVMIMWLVRLQSRVKFHEQLWRTFGRDQKAVLVDWPQNFFLKLSRMWQLELDWPEREVAPQKIEVAPWVQCHAALGLLAIRRKTADAVEVRVMRSAEVVSWESRLEQALARKFKVEIKS